MRFQRRSKTTLLRLRSIRCTTISSVSIKRSRYRLRWPLAFRTTLWEVSDIVTMLGAVGAGELQAGISIHRPAIRMIGKGHSVSVMWRGGEVDTIFGFEKGGGCVGMDKGPSLRGGLLNRIGRRPDYPRPCTEDQLDGRPSLKTGEKVRIFLPNIAEDGVKLLHSLACPLEHSTATIETIPSG